ncbi:TPA: hypothetical protein OUL50_001964 [Clostridioides difficile]|nr:hypothetical protein [Clostridioides difficile]HBF9262856.1 hypothetical protein [Clostridioides difficile]HBG1536306.1 hypothetical protein [Clostridioides difficile]HCU2754266.1 hypothetical protein [Clostridioides difficile]HDX7086019.1 hypothetical protein [Clostridioides difficile]
MHKIHVSLDDKSFEFIETLKKEKNCNRSKIISDIIREYMNNVNENEIFDIIADKLFDRIKIYLSSTKKTTSIIDENVQILIELINGIYLKEKYVDVVSTDVISSKALDSSKKIVKDRQILNKYKKEGKLY